MLALVAANSAYAPGIHVPPRAAVGFSRATSIRMDEASPLEAVQKAYSIFQASKAEGFDFKQSVADAIAGEYDRDAVTAEVQALASSAPMVLFTWESSPACKKALKLIAETGASPKIVRLDDPWSEGNVKRAALGRLTGKSSVPSIWIGGEYIGGCDDGPSDASPGLVPWHSGAHSRANLMQLARSRSRPRQRPRPSREVFGLYGRTCGGTP